VAHVGHKQALGLIGAAGFIGMTIGQAHGLFQLFVGAPDFPCPFFHPVFQGFVEFFQLDPGPGGIADVPGKPNHQILVLVLQVVGRNANISGTQRADNPGVEIRDAAFMPDLAQFFPQFGLNFHRKELHLVHAQQFILAVTQQLASGLVHPLKTTRSAVGNKNGILGSVKNTLV